MLSNFLMVLYNSTCICFNYIQRHCIQKTGVASLSLHYNTMCCMHFPMHCTNIYCVQDIPVADLHSKILDARPPLGGPNSFNFMQFLGKFGKIVCWRPPLGSWRPLLGEILDPPLHTSVYLISK